MPSQALEDVWAHNRGLCVNPEIEVKNPSPNTSYSRINTRKARPSRAIASTLGCPRTGRNGDVGGVGGRRRRAIAWPRLRSPLSARRSAAAIPAGSPKQDAAGSVHAVPRFAKTAPRCLHARC
jgi:hypothetical protein